jgi:ArsR family transcriptional regulator, arsenate/arsenite/antimonite-responsive transcriptional repressor
MVSKCGAQAAGRAGVRDTPSPCCTGLDAERRDVLARVGKALSDPIRLEMLDFMARGRGCCELPDPATRGVPGADEPAGICVCEFQEQFGLGQSKVSYHLGVLKEAGLIHVEGRGKWSFYAIDREAAAEAVHAFGELLRV